MNSIFHQRTAGLTVVCSLAKVLTMSLRSSHHEIPVHDSNPLSMLMMALPLCLLSWFSKAGASGVKGAHGLEKLRVQFCPHSIDSGLPLSDKLMSPLDQLAQHDSQQPVQKISHRACAPQRRPPKGRERRGGGGCDCTLYNFSRGSCRSKIGAYMCKTCAIAFLKYATRPEQVCEHTHGVNDVLPLDLAVHGNQLVEHDCQQTVLDCGPPRAL